MSRRAEHDNAIGAFFAPLSWKSQALAAILPVPFRSNRRRSPRASSWSPPRP